MYLALQRKESTSTKEYNLLPLEVLIETEMHSGFSPAILGKTRTISFGPRILIGRIVRCDCLGAALRKRPHRITSRSLGKRIY
jgi:hypothetical protein